MTDNKDKNYKLLQHKFSDMYFRVYLRKNSKYSNWTGLVYRGEESILYKYNTTNPNSICGQIEHGLVNQYDNILLKILCCRTDGDFNNIIKNIIIKEMKLAFTYIYDFCKSLYK